MLVRLAKRHGCTLVNVVRREAQASALRALGAEHIVVSSSPDAAEELSSLCKRFDIRFAIDAVAGPETGRLLSALADGGCVMVYGMLSGQPAQVDADDLVFRRKTLAGFTMYDWVASTSMLGQLRMLRAAQRRLGDDLRSDIRAKLPLSDPSEALSRARTGSSEGKILFNLS